MKKNYDVMLVPTEEYRDTKLAKLAGFWYVFAVGLVYSLLLSSGFQLKLLRNSVNATLWRIS